MKLISSPDKLFDNELFQGADPLRDAISGFIASLVTVGYCISFAALIFQGTIADGIGLGLSALLTGTIVTGAIIALTTTLAPADAGPDTPAVAVMSVLAGSIAAGFSAKGLPASQAVIHVLLAITMSTILTGVMLLAFGSMRLGEWLRFVPYPVIGGFLAASGWLLATGGIEVMSGVSLGLSLKSMIDTFAPVHLPHIAVGLGFVVAVFLIRSRSESFLVLPLTFLAFVIVADTVLLGFGQAEALGGHGSWFIEGMGDLKLWLPAAVVFTESIDWSVFAANAAEICAVCGVTAVSMLLDVSSLEVARQKAADLDGELRTNGIANIVAGVVGGVAGNLSLNGSILINEAGAASRLSGVCAAIVTTIVLMSGIDLASLIPTPILGGLLVYLGIVILIEAIIRAPARRSKTDFALAAAIMAVIVYSGYLMGVLLGVVGACLLFAFSYSRIGVVSRHLTRKDCASNVERGPEQARLLREHGDRIHVFWLSGFIFFGSSNGLFEYVRRCMDTRKGRESSFMILDFSAVPGLDTSAVLSLVKLRNYCDERGARLAFSGLTEAMQKGFEGAGFFATGSHHKVFPHRNDALEWSENELLSGFDLAGKGEEPLEAWMGRELGSAIDVKRLTAYFERIDIAADDELYGQGAPSDSIDLLSTGCVAITIKTDKGRSLRLRRMAAQTVVGEMGFYRDVPRGASVVAIEPSVVFRLTREAFARMQKEDPEAASAFHRFIIRVLSDRLEFANREIAALL